MENGGFYASGNGMQPSSYHFDLGVRSVAGLGVAALLSWKVPSNLIGKCGKVGFFCDGAIAQEVHYSSLPDSLSFQTCSASDNCRAEVAVMAKDYCEEGTPFTIKSTMLCALYYDEGKRICCGEILAFKSSGKVFIKDVEEAVSPLKIFPKQLKDAYMKELEEARTKHGAILKQINGRHARDLREAEGNYFEKVGRILNSNYSPSVE